MGKKGRKNWREAGNMKETRRRVATTVLKMGPGEAMMDNEKIPRTMRMRYWPS